MKNYLKVHYASVWPRRTKTSLQYESFIEPLLNVTISNLKKICLALLSTCFVSQSFAQVILTEGYTDKRSYHVGETVTIYASGNPNGGYQVPLLDIKGNTAAIVPGFDSGQLVAQSPTTTHPYSDGYGFSPTTTWVVPSLSSGYYFLNSHSGGNIPIIIKGSSGSNIIVVLPTNTDEAYSCDGGGSLYGDPNHGCVQSTTVSFMRPAERQTVGSSNFTDGFLNWFVNWQPSSGYSTSYISDMDMDDYTEISGAKLLIITGHSEYWTRQAKLNLDQFINNGGNVLVLSGNTMGWEVRYSSDKSQLICYRDYNSDPESSIDPLLTTVHWNTPVLQYSNLGTIGSDWIRGGFGIEGSSVASSPPYCDYGGFGGYKVLLPLSPILSGMSYSLGGLIANVCGEFDGSLMKRDASGNIVPDVNGYPQLDVPALGFYRAEMIAFDETDGAGSPSNPMNYCPIIAFQKTCSSGKVINVNSNMWCSLYGMGGAAYVAGDNCGTFYSDPNLTQITQNMVSLLASNSNIFANSAPTAFYLEPEQITVGYTACSTGSIDITPCGVNITQGYRVDGGVTYDQTNNFNIITANPFATPYEFHANVNASCTNYNNGLSPIRGKPEEAADSIQGKDFRDLVIYPNPNNGSFTISLPKDKLSDVYVYNLLGNLVLFKKQLNGVNQIDMGNESPGMYFVKAVLSNGQTFDKKVLITR